MTKTRNSLVIAIMALLLVSCGYFSGREKGAYTSPENSSSNGMLTEASFALNESEILLAYLEESGNIINSASVPALINADYLYDVLDSPNIKIIDLRLPEEFATGYIKNSINIVPHKILDHFHLLKLYIRYV